MCPCTSRRAPATLRRTTPARWLLQVCVLLLLLDMAAERHGAWGAVPLSSQRQTGSIPGDFIIGALFPVHQSPDAKNAQTRTCGEVREHYGIQRVEASLHTIDDINRNDALLPNVTLGIEIRDSCWYSPTALEQSIEFIRDAISAQETSGVSGQNLTESPAACPKGPARRVKNLVGVIGPGSSAVTIQVQNLLQLFNIPQIGYSATSRQLSSKQFFKYFLRVVPSDQYQSQMMVDTLLMYNWTYISTVNTEGNYGYNGIDEFTSRAKDAGICVANSHAIPTDADDEDYDSVVRSIDKFGTARVVVCFCEGFTVQALINATARLRVAGKYIFFGSDGWSDRQDVVKNQEKASVGSLSIRFHANYDHDFDRYYFGLNPFSNVRNPWFKEFWEVRFNCSLGVGPGSARYNRTCTGKEDLREGHKQDTKVEFVKKSIYTMAYGLHNMHRDLCPNTSGVCPAMVPVNGSVFLQYLMNATFAWNNETVFFHENGDPPGRYDLMNYQQLGEHHYDYVQVGSWVNGELTMTGEVQWHQAQRKTPPVSICSLPCEKGKVKSIHSETMKCCWNCVACKENQYVKDDYTCLDCERGWWPNENLTGCVRIPEEYIHWTDSQSLAAMSIACLGLMATLAAMIIFIRHNDTPVVKSSTRELSYIILVGMFLCHGTTFALLAKPSALTCFITRVLPGLSFAMIYAALVTKTNRIARILAGSKKKIITKKPRFMSATAQVVITWLLISVEAAIIGAMVVLEPPDSMFAYPALDRVKLICNTTTLGIIAPLGFDFFLIAMCTVYAVKTRNVPENFNEAKFIGFTMYTTLVIWAAFVPIYFGSKHKVITLCLCISFSAEVALVLLFMPRVYIILFRPDKNNRSAFTTSKDVRCHIGYMNSNMAAATAAGASAVSRNSSHSTSEFSMESPRNHTAETVIKPPPTRTKSLNLLERFRASKQDRIAASVAQHIRAVRAAEALDRRTHLRHSVEPLFGTSPKVPAQRTSSDSPPGAHERRRLVQQQQAAAAYGAASASKREVSCQTTDDLVEMWMPCLRRRIARSETLMSTLSPDDEDDVAPGLRHRKLCRHVPSVSDDEVLDVVFRGGSSQQQQEYHHHHHHHPPGGSVRYGRSGSGGGASSAASAFKSDESLLEGASSIVEESASSGSEDAAVYKNIIISLGSPDAVRVRQTPASPVITPRRGSSGGRSASNGEDVTAVESTSSSPWAEVSAQLLLRSYNGNAQGTGQQPVYWAGPSSGCSDQERFGK
ncbi:metabotropic glutamate receptor 5-like isoform X2 [Dermacentor variabilis]|uniref:metabotropic glutamate receptor 5-like isoform X2 n=1 Tax=Dermacentor variabilis TaxID=34621 RepID=UPI003F5C46A3